VYILIMAFCADFDWAEVGERIRARRLAGKMTQQQLATGAGLTQNAIFRLENGNTNPQINTLREVARALGTNVRQLVCGLTGVDPQFGNRFTAIRRILESGDDAAIRAMDSGLENAQTILNRTRGLREGRGVAGGISGKLRRPLEPDETLQLLLSATPGPQGAPYSATPLSRRTSKAPKKEIETMNGYRLDDAPHLPVGNARKIALPNSNRPKEHNVHHNRTAASARTEDPQR
jgi:transcriptional regulator with XRE-family HTH domain